MLEQNKSASPENEVPFHCAYNFPAVLLTLSSKAWPKLLPIYRQLVRDQRVRVRRTLAFSIHEVAKIVGPEETEKELLPVLQLFMRDVSEVREGITESLPKFIKMLSREQREHYAEKIASAQGEVHADWRKRIVLAHQIRKFSKVFSAETVHKHYLPLYFQLC